MGGDDGQPARQKPGSESSGEGLVGDEKQLRFDLNLVVVFTRFALEAYNSPLVSASISPDAHHPR